MDANVLKNFIDGLLADPTENGMKIYFSRWASSKYVSHLPQLSNELQQEIATTVLTPLRGLLCNNIVAYNPIGVADGEIESIEAEKIVNATAFLDSISENSIFTDMTTLKIDSIGFYCIELANDEGKIHLFRQFQKLKKLRKGILAQLVNNELRAMEGSFLGIDEAVDLVLFNDTIFLINHISIERIFKYRDEFLKKTYEALGELLTKNIILNIEQFQEDCCNDIRIMKRFTNIMNKERLPLFFDNYEKVPEIVSKLGLDIEFDMDRKMIYREKSQLFHIINLLSDSYFKTLLAERTGVAKTEGEL